MNLKSLLSDAINLRLRSDVTVGSCLSGGLDSSSIVCLAAELLQAKSEFAGQETVTACYTDKRYDEWDFAEEVIRKTKANPHQIFPTFDDLQTELDKFLWHQDDPTGSTSQFSQWSVFKKTHEVGLKVMIDGQGADEQLAGYGGNDLPFYAGLMRGMKLRSLVDEMRSYKKEKGAIPVGFLLGAAQLTLG
ncbi:asparagine synthase C-terminal domain-containing protein, partial [Pollutibacter soli]|uniref:asparagine synthase C-terminal domain-containing protein n=1 Tax=Pollutibacter soli TaxID=3034157 RepID=UPI003013F2C9